MSDNLDQGGLPASLFINRQNPAQGFSITQEKEIMKTTEHFKKAIKTHLDKRAVLDGLFAERYGDPGKNLDDCITYILKTVKESGCNGFADEEIFSMAIHYYTEENINVGKPMNCNVVVNHAVELTEEEKEEARNHAKRRFENEIYDRMRRRQNKPVISSREPEVITQTLFDL